jgi:hypothetical protein
MSDYKMTDALGKCLEMNEKYIFVSVNGGDKSYAIGELIEIMNAEDWPCISCKLKIIKRLSGYCANTEDVVRRSTVTVKANSLIRYKGYE